MSKCYLYVDGNYLFFQAKALGLKQDFNTLSENLKARIGFSNFEAKRFYTRPPRMDGAKPLMAWLKARNWDVHLFPYQGTVQDTLNARLIADLMGDMLSEFDAGSDASFVLVTGSGAIYPALERMKQPIERGQIAVHLVGTTESMHGKLLTVPGVSCIDLETMLK